MSENLIVKIAEGAVRGEKLESIRNGFYYSFKGIPYAKPPVGELRFKPPQPPEPWTGVRDALKEGSPAPSMDLITQQYVQNSSEDCLFINVYTPTLPEIPESKEELKPVLFWVHGGAFRTGSGDTSLYGPDYLITEDIVLVTFNYRLGVLGFLSVGTAEYPGNYALKDMVEALKWVQRNISAFGGNPNNVTIFGESSGGASVQHLLLSKLTKGLFHKAISESGAAISPWAVSQDPKKVAFKLGELLGIDTTDENELMTFFKSVEPKKLVETEAALLALALNPDTIFMSLNLIPSIEPDIEGAFITEHPKEIIRKGDFNDVPYIIGVNTLEGLVSLPLNHQSLNFETDDDYSSLAPPDMNIKHGTEEAKEVGKKIREFYFPNGFDLKPVVDALSGGNFIQPANNTLEYLRNLSERSSSTYAYLFTFDGNKAVFKPILGFGDWEGTAHGDELGYLFQFNIVDAQLIPGTPEYTTVERMTKLWTDFAKYGNPTPEDGLWTPIAQDKLSFLEIGKDLTIRDGINQEEATKFWNDLYESLGTRAK